MKIILTVCLLLALSIPATAQENTNAINYCAGELTYDLPEGWVAGETLRNQYSAQSRLASSQAALDNETLEEGEALIGVTALGRRSLTMPMRLDDDADLTDILASVMARVSSPFTAEAIMPITLRDHPAARVEVHAGTLDMLMFALDLEAETVGLVSISAPAGEIEQWDEAAVTFAESLTFDAARFSVEHDNVTLAEAHASEDCAVAFAYPTDWELMVADYLDSGDRLVPGYTLSYGQEKIEITVSTPDASAGGEMADYAEQVRQEHDFELVSQSDTSISRHPALISELRASGEPSELAAAALVVTTRYPDDTVVTLALYSTMGDIAHWQIVALAIAESIQINAVSE